jgi:hypothetical protein
LIKVAFADEGTGLEEVVQPWVEGVLGMLVQVYVAEEGGNKTPEEKKKETLSACVACSTRGEID